MPNPIVQAGLALQQAAGAGAGGPTGAQFVQLPPTLVNIPGIAQILTQLEKGGLFGFVLPFIFIFVLVYAVLSGMPIVKGVRGRTINTVLALVVALYTMAFSPFALFLQQASVGTAIIMTISLFILMALELVHRGASPGTILHRLIGRWAGWIALGAILFITIFSWSSLEPIVGRFINLPGVLGTFLVLGFIGWALSKMSRGFLIEKTEDELKELREARAKAIARGDSDEAERLERQIKFKDAYLHYQKTGREPLKE